MKKEILLIVLIVGVSSAIYSNNTLAWPGSPPLRVFDCYHENNGVLDPFPYARNLGPGQSCPSVPPSATGHNKVTPTSHDCRVVIDNWE